MLLIVKTPFNGQEEIMDMHVIHYFLAAAREGNITKAAKRLHMTQPTLSRQLAELESELGVRLFERSSRRITLTSEGILFRRRAEEMEELLAKTKEEISSGEELAGTVAVGGGELLVTSVFVSLIRKFQKEHPHVFFDYQTGVTDRVTERMDMGLIDAAVLVRPFDSVKYDSVPIGPDARWGVIMRANDPLAEKESIRKEDLLGKTVILPGRLELNAEIANWLGSVRKTITSPIKWDLGGSRVILAEDPGCYVITTEGAAALFDERRLSFLPLEPERKIETVIAWKKDQPFGRAAEAFIRFLQKEAAEKGL